MVTCVNIVYSRLSDLESVRRHFPHCANDRLLIQVFSGRISRSDIETILDDLQTVFPGAPVIGCTTAGEIIDGSVSDGRVIISVTFFDHSTVHATLVDGNDDLAAAGRALSGNLAPWHPKAVILLGSGVKAGRTVDASPLLAEVHAALPGVVIAGGQAGDNGHGLATFVFTESGITEAGVVGATLSGDSLAVNRHYGLNWVPIGKKLVIDKATGRRVHSIDGRSPYELYRHYLGQEVVDGLPLAAADFPLIIERHGIRMAVHAVGINDDGSFDYIHSFHAGEQVQFGYCHAGLLAGGAQEMSAALRQHPTEAAFIYSCVSRKWILGGSVDVEIAPVAALAPTAGFFSYGEYFTHATGGAQFFSQTMTVLTLAETDRAEGDRPGAGDVAPLTEQDNRQLKTLRVLHRLVETSAKEVESINRQLMDMANEDALTGLRNRRHLDLKLTEEIYRAKRAGTSISLILIDIDHFKAFNDTYGHVEGDSCLRGIASVLKTVPRRTIDIVARYGGEEFACVLPETEFEGAMQVAEAIRRDVMTLGIPHEVSPTGRSVTVSIGVQTLATVPDALSAETLIHQTDRLLYAAKNAGRNRVMGDSG